MNKFLIILALAAGISACNNDASTDTKAADTSAADKTEVTKAPETPAAPAVKDSVMQFKDGKVMVMTGGSWAALSATVTTSNGRKVNPNGEVSKGKVTRKMEEGMMIDKDGQMMDKDGKMMDNTGWE